MAQAQYGSTVYAQESKTVTKQGNDTAGKKKKSSLKTTATATPKANAAQRGPAVPLAQTGNERASWELNEPRDPVMAQTDERGRPYRYAQTGNSVMAQTGHTAMAQAYAHYGK